ncbi:hypothetical protein F5879DRAFT_940014 [Lentinula edodes]|uniref:Endoplasmic reticulum protein n=2 Tax=Lentinula TaxID=5352 RepID=A0A1Q3EQ09_LENED|nr:uncharacterized protein C8R40DRAFT_253254 [Lentinula edodes]KAF8832580.1 hypothetical protein HHX47_DHR1001630 [Lentinula edodes]KAH7880440.1 hypothetical protein C8R40DRAFT_253254 [Lentinula edodes]KAJ3882309.1 hypothetical protein F5051DRAFT_344808 [Lentinula edodes]KAJ3893746.1 hypothetical protein GG344DRAFT_74776 [Lentinula edodes]KAJ3907860.1 hypothetical protein F5879DRAFT_940014 [Lentinula edodes]
MATTQHYLWASGHFILLLSALRYFFAYATFKTVSPIWYKACYTGALLSYAIVCQKSLGVPQPNMAYVRKALLDENVQYFILAFFWWTSKPIAITLIPFMIFSLFHALTFTRTTLMPQFLPPGPPATADGPPTPHHFAKQLQVWVKANYDTAMKAVAYAELIIFVRVLFGVLLFWNSILSPIIYAHFLRQRWYQSSFTRDAVTYTVVRIDGIVAGQGNPTLTNIWTQGKGLVARWGGSTLTPAQGARAAR